MLYSTEKELHHQLLDVDFYIGEEPWLVAVRSQVSINGRIPDIVMIHFENQIPEFDRLPKKITPLHSAVISFLKEEGASGIKKISNNLFQDYDLIEKMVNELISYDFIFRVTKAKFDINDKLKYMKVEVVAIEVKLKRWEEAIYQAYAYQWFADRTIVVMDPNGIPKSDDAKDKFIKYEVGLCSYNGDFVDWILESPVNQVNKHYIREFLILSVLIDNNQVWRRRHSSTALNQ